MDKEDVQKLFTEIVPEMFRLTAEDKLKVETTSIHLRDIEKAWGMEMADGRRLVVII